ncbi:MAG: hypothetical protein V1729_02465 [Candidatus Woesearchaeota archaeon]
MSRNYISLFAVLGIMVMLLSIFGCQGYKAPDYKSPADDEGLEQVEIDVSDLEDDGFWAEDDAEADSVKEDDFWTDEEAAPAKEDSDKESLKGVTGNVVAADKFKPIAAEPTKAVAADDSFKKSPYRSIVTEDLPTLTVTEGELVKLTVKATDADGDKLSYTFTEPLDKNGEWQTSVGDADVYYPEITVSDGKETVVKRIKIVVEPKNNKPVLEFIPNVEVDEGETVTLVPQATDADRDKLSYSFSGWMNSGTKTASYTDSGVHKVVVSVTDGISTVSQEVTVKVNDVNRAPVVEIEF